MVCDTCVVNARAVDGGMCNMSVGETVVASCRAPGQPVEHHGIDFPKARCVDARVAESLERWSYEAWVAGSGPARGKLIACSDHMLPSL